MASIDCCNTFTNPSSSFINVVDNGEGTVSSEFNFQSIEGGDNNSCNSGVHITFQKQNGLFLGGFTFNEGDDLSTATPSSSLNNWDDFKPHVSGNITHGGTLSIASLDLMKSLGCFDDAVGGDSNTLEVKINIIDCVTGELSNNPDNILSFTEVYQPPVARLHNVNFIGGASGIFTFDQEIKKYDGITSLGPGDLGRYTIKDGATGDVLEVIEGNYNDPISSFIQVSNPYGVASSVLNWITGSFADGSTLNFAKLDWALANGFTYQNGNLTNSSWISSAKKIEFCIEAFDNLECSWNKNQDISIGIDRTVDLIEGSVFLQNSALNPFFLYSMYDGDANIYNDQSNITVREGGVEIPFTLPNLTPITFVWGTRDVYNFNGIDDTSYEVDLSFNNGMNAYTNSLTTSNNGAGSDLNVGYNRSLSDPILNTFDLTIESLFSNTIVKRAIFVNNFYNLTFPSNGLDVLVNGVLVYNKVPYINFSSTSVGITDWFDLDMHSIGKRNTIRYQGEESGLYIFNEYQLELNYIY